MTYVKSGRQDLNLRPSGPKPDALARLSYAPGEWTLPRCFQGVNGEDTPEGVGVRMIVGGDPQKPVLRGTKIILSGP